MVGLSVDYLACCRPSPIIFRQFGHWSRRKVK